MSIIVIGIIFLCGKGEALFILGNILLKLSKIILFIFSLTQNGVMCLYLDAKEAGIVSSGKGECSDTISLYQTLCFPWAGYTGA